MDKQVEYELKCLLIDLAETAENIPIDKVNFDYYIDRIKELCTVS